MTTGYKKIVVYDGFKSVKWTTFVTNTPGNPPYYSDFGLYSDNI